MSKDDHTDDEQRNGESLSKLLQRLQLPHIRASYHELAQTAAEQGWGHLDYLQRLIEGEVGALPGAKDPGSVPVDLAEENQPTADPEPLPFELHRAEGQRDLPGHRGPRQNSPEHRLGTSGLCPRLLGALHHRRGHYQHPGSGPVRRPSQARVPPLPEARRIDCR